MKMKSFIWLNSVAVLSLLLAVSSGCSKDEETEKMSIGDSYGGGIVFYVDDSGKHGMICAPTDQSTALTWWNGSNVITGAFGSDHGTGKINTDLIVAAQGAGNYAAKVCDDLVLGGYSDWFLPSKSECFTMYFNLALMRQIGDFAASPALYWSSTESSYDLAYSQYGNDGYGPTGGYYKNSAYHVRAIRYF